MSKTNTFSRRQILAGGLAGLAAGPAAFAATKYNTRDAGESKRVMRLAHLTDVHVQQEREGDNGFAACLKHVQEQDDKPDFIIFGGDNLMNVDSEEGSQSADAQLQTWKRVLHGECELPHGIVIGNHDILRFDPQEGKQWAVDAFELPGRYYAFDRAGWRFIMLDSTSPEPGGYKGRLDDEQFYWLEEQLEATPESMPICVTSHIPLVTATAFFCGDRGKSGNWDVPGSWMHIDAARVAELFSKHPNVKLCLSGHMHMADVVDYFGVRYACNGAVSGAWWDGAYFGFEPGYALIDLYDNGAAEVDFVTYGWKTKG
jgi:3',5'-cyclic AMP phosphodiesterase CpdA